MKNKLIILYIISILLAIFFLNKLLFFGDYLNNSSDYIRLDKLKLINYIKLTGDNNTNPNLNRDIIDESNNNLLGNNFKKAKELLQNKKELKYTDFYNLGNINLLEGLYKLKYSTGDNGNYIKSFQESINNYNTALDSKKNKDSSYFIINNLNLSQLLLKFSYVYFCSNKFTKLINKNNEILKKLENIVSILKQQLKPLKKWENYDNLKKCIKQIKNEINKNIENLYDNKNFFKETKKGLIKLYKNYNKNEDICYKEKEIIDNKYKKSLESSYKYFNNFLTTQSKLLLVYNKATYKEMLYYCENKSKLAEKQNKKNKEMQKNFKNLKDLMKKKYTQKQKRKKEKGNNKGKNGKYKKERENIEKEMKKLIERIQKYKTEKNYNPKKYIDNLFKKFYGNDKDFIEGKKINEPGK